MSYDAFACHALQIACGYAVIFTTLKYTYPWPSAILHWHRFAFLTDSILYIKIEDTISIEY